MLSMQSQIELNIEQEKTCTIIRRQVLPYLEREGVPIKDEIVMLYKKVSHEFKTQEGTPNETLWQIGSIVTHPKWDPSKEECGIDKFHACSRPYFCDDFRKQNGDRYIAVEIKVEDLYEWLAPLYPHKIAFREGKVLYEVAWFGEIKKGLKENENVPS